MSAAVYFYAAWAAGVIAMFPWLAIRRASDPERFAEFFERNTTNTRAVRCAAYMLTAALWPVLLVVHLVDLIRESS